MTTVTAEHNLYRNTKYTNRFICHEDVVSEIELLKENDAFGIEEIGMSAQQRSIYKLTIGTGKTTVMLWSQMHGNEATGMLAFLDLFNFLTANDANNTLRKQILDSCTLHFIPMVNPDGAEMHTRRNAQGIDINRDFLRQESPEAKLLARMQRELKPEFGFNMHDQETLWSVKGHKKPATVSLLAPPPDEFATVTPFRLKAMQVIAALASMLNEQAAGYLGRWDETFEPRAFGDNFQKLGTATILVEGGGYPNDFERQYARKLNFDVLISALHQIATGDYTDQTTESYYAIPENNKEIFHFLIKDCELQTAGGTIRADIGLNYNELIDLKNQTSAKIYTVTDIGDLSTWGAYDIADAKGAAADMPVVMDAVANFSITISEGVVGFRKGVLI